MMLQVLQQLQIYLEFASSLQHCIWVLKGLKQIDSITLLTAGKTAIYNFISFCVPYI